MIPIFSNIYQTEYVHIKHLKNNPDQYTLLDSSYLLIRGLTGSVLNTSTLLKPHFFGQYGKVESLEIEACPIGLYPSRRCNPITHQLRIKFESEISSYLAYFALESFSFRGHQISVSLCPVPLLELDDKLDSKSSQSFVCLQQTTSPTIFNQCYRKHVVTELFKRQLDLKARSLKNIRECTAFPSLVPLLEEISFIHGPSRTFDELILEDPEGVEFQPALTVFNDWKSKVDRHADSLRIKTSSATLIFKKSSNFEPHPRHVNATTPGFKCRCPNCILKRYNIRQGANLPKVPIRQT